MVLTRQNSLGWHEGSTGNALTGRPELACVRQIAHEVLVTLWESVPEFKESAKPVVPSSNVGTTGGQAHVYGVNFGPK